ncbi:RNA-directed DNA polymerase, eukaryota, reverse transcriptase zinc-binding domain protein [Tanacetum coccineum]|uniref:RNA-directed DNA polymerase, eukaryota, reverse transcriptase zinc-binding domain protein n=1 Tax=Tanacetum coccineum TaxID=301880 RepID=A0ABQ5GCT2_9ASTR
MDAYIFVTTPEICEVAFKELVPRLYALETQKDIKVASKLSHGGLEESFRRVPRGGVEQAQLEILKEKMEGCILNSSNDRWSWSLDGSGEFSVSSVRKAIDDSLLPHGTTKTRWIKTVPIKINIHAWKVKNDCLPTRFNISRRGMDIDSILCPICESTGESSKHLFFSCSFVKDIMRKGGALEKDSAPHLTARQEQTVKLLESHKALSAEMGLFDFIKTADPRKVQAVEVQKGDDQVTLLESTQHCFMPLVIPAAGGSSSAAAAEVAAPTEERQENVAPEEAYLELADPDEGTAAVRQSEEEVVTEQPKKVKKKRLLKQSDVLPAKKLRTDHPTLVSGTGGKTLAGLEHIRLVGSRLPDREQLAFHSVAPSSQASEGFLDSSAQTNLRIRNVVESSSTLGIPVDTTAAATTSARANPDLAGPSQPEESEGSDDSFYEPPTLDPSEAKRCGPSCSPAFFSTLHTMDYDQLYMKFNVRAARQICLGAEVRSCAEHELELKEKLRAKYVARVSSLSGEKYALAAEVSLLNVTVTQKDHDISLLNSRVACLASTLDDAKVACAEVRDKITSLASERDRLASEVSSLCAGFQDFKEKMEIQQEEQAHKLFNRVAELKAHVMDVSGRLEEEFYPAYLTTLAGKRWLLTHGIQLALLKCLEAGYKHGVAGRSLFVVDAYNPEVAKSSYINTIKAFKDIDFPLVYLLKSKKDAGMDEVLDCFLLDGPLVGLPEAAYLKSCIEQLSIPIYHAGDNTVIGETSLSFALMNVHARVEGAKKHAAALCKLMMEIVSTPLSSQTWVGEASTSMTPLSIEDYEEEDTDEALGSVVAIPKLETCHF